MGLTNRLRKSKYSSNSLQSSDLSELKRDQSIVHPDSSIFRVFEDGYTVRSMAPSDAVTVQEWQSKIGFPPQPDLEILLELHPPGSRGLYVGEFEGQAVASLIQVRWSENVLYATAFYVEDKFRRRGFGSRLLNVVAREHAGNGIVVLDSVGGWVAEIYQSWGYKEAFKTEWVRGVAKAAYNVEEFDGKLQFSKEVDFEEILRYDSKCLVSRDFPTRRDFLRKLIDVPRGSTIVAVTGSGSVVGFGCRRPCIREGYHIVGPLYAEDGTIAEAILAKLCSEVAGNYINMDICVPNNAAVVVAKHFELEHMQYFHRMHLNGDPHEFKVEVFAVTSTDSCGF